VYLTDLMGVLLIITKVLNLEGKKGKYDLWIIWNFF